MTPHFTTPLRNPHTFYLTVASHQVVPLARTPLEVPMELSLTRVRIAVTLQTH